MGYGLEGFITAIDTNEAMAVIPALSYHGAQRTYEPHRAVINFGLEIQADWNGGVACIRFCVAETEF